MVTIRLDEITVEELKAIRELQKMGVDDAFIQEVYDRKYKKTRDRKNSEDNAT